MLLDWNRAFVLAQRCETGWAANADISFRLVDEITYKKASEAADVATQSAILGPFFQEDNKLSENGASIYLTEAKGAEVVYMYGRVTDAQTKAPLANATIDVWQASTNGMVSLFDIHREKMLVN